MKYHRLRLSKQIKYSALCLCVLLSLSIYAEQIGSEYGCNNLHKVQNIDDLLAQFYANIDTLCLFEIPKKELEKAWGLRIFETDLQNITEQTSSEIAAMFKYHNNENGIYIMTGSDNYGYFFEPIVSKKFLEVNQKIWGNTELSESTVSILPPYHQKRSTQLDYASSDFNLISYACSLKEEESKEQLICFHEYIWKNSKNSPDLPHLLISTIPPSISKKSVRFYKSYKLSKN